MDFEFSTEQEMLRTSVRAFLAAKAPIASVRAAYDDATFDPQVWRELCDLGVVGLGMVDSAVVLEELGRALCPAPYIASAIGAAPFIADATRVATVAIFEPDGRYEWRVPSTRASNRGSGWSLDGVKVNVLDAFAADIVFVTALDPDGELGMFSSTTGVAAPIETVDGSRKVGTLTFADAPADRIDASPDDIARTLDRLGVALAVDGVGAAQRALELAVEYAKEREQFGKPIGAFQAVQHLCADMLRTVELGRAAAYYACWALDEASPEEAHRAATLARAFAADAFPTLGGTAIQVFGGIGFTWEHDIHLFYKRLLSCSLTLGAASDHLAELAHLAID